MKRESCIYEGWVRHRRFAPVAHAFRYPLFMMYLDLAELPELFRGRWLWSAARPAFAWFRRADHWGDARVPLDQAIRDLVESRLGQRPVGPIRLLTQLRYAGYVFNPVSFYFCHHKGKEGLQAVVMEVNNTPWGERVCYVVNGDDATGAVAAVPKQMHVSPFLPMDIEYMIRMGVPDRHWTAHMECRGDNGVVLDASVRLQRLEITAVALARMLWRYPLMTARVWWAIHWQAFRLWWKGVPMFSHPHSVLLAEKETCTSD